METHGKLGAEGQTGLKDYNRCAAKTTLDTLPSSTIWLHNLTSTTQPRFWKKPQALCVSPAKCLAGVPHLTSLIQSGKWGNIFECPAQHHLCVMATAVQSANKKYDFPPIPNYYITIKRSVTALMCQSVQAKYLNVCSSSSSWAFHSLNVTGYFLQQVTTLQFPFYSLHCIVLLNVDMCF